MSLDGQLPPKMRLLRAAAELLAKSGGAAVSTRQITQLAGVTAPTLYHHFGDKEGLFDAVVAAGFEEYVAGERDFAPSGQPLEDIRRMWDNHVRAEPAGTVPGDVRQYPSGKPSGHRG